MPFAPFLHLPNGDGSSMLWERYNHLYDLMHMGNTAFRENLLDQEYKLYRHIGQERHSLAPPMLANIKVIIKKECIPKEANKQALLAPYEAGKKYIIYLGQFSQNSSFSSCFSSKHSRWR
ncbi:hypothetical protein ACS0TY_013060 [Phlomoides rotata]